MVTRDFVGFVAVETVQDIITNMALADVKVHMRGTIDSLTMQVATIIVSENA